MQRIHIPTLNDDAQDYTTLFTIWNHAHTAPDGVIWDFSTCAFLRQNAVAFLGGLTCALLREEKAIQFEWNTLRPAIRTNLAQNGFLSAFGYHQGPWQGNSIAYRHDPTINATSFLTYLRENWLGRGWVSIAPELRDTIAGRILELYFNAFEHGQSPLGVFSCGQYYPTHQRLGLTIVDFGIGIPGRVRAHCRNPRVSAAQTLRWAFQRGTTTDPQRTSRGLGLDLIKAFVRANHGRLEIYSHDGHALIDRQQERYLTHEAGFTGTLVNVMLTCNPADYQVTPPTASGPLF